MAEESESSSTMSKLVHVAKITAPTLLGIAAFALYNKYTRAIKNAKKSPKQNAQAFWTGTSVSKISEIPLSAVLELFRVARRMERDVKRQGGNDLARHRVLTTLFYEPSTRTRCSFQAAMQRLGGSVLTISDIASSSVSKGESFSDTMRCLASYSDAIVLRHPEKGSADAAIAALSPTNSSSDPNPQCPILNAGDGAGEHPTQALLDLFTIFKHRGYRRDGFDGLTVTFVGDLKFGRTAHSLVPALAMFPRVRINLVAPRSLQMPQEVIHRARRSGGDRGIGVHEYVELGDEVLRRTDVLYVTRIQKERFASSGEYQAVKGCFVVDREVMRVCKRRMCVLHPLPRVDEISTEVDRDPRAKYFEQMENGMYVRMALLALVLGLKV